MKSHYIHQLALVGATLVVVGALTPATQAKAADKQTAFDFKQEQKLSTSHAGDQTIQALGQQTTQTATQVPFIDNSTAGATMKVRVHCVDHYNNDKPIQDVLVDATYFRTVANDSPEYQYRKPVIAGYTSAAYYGDGELVPFHANGALLKEYEMTVNYHSTVQDTVGAWVQENGTWFYKFANGVTVKGWTQKNGKWYFLDKTTGAMKTGWYNDNGTWYYLYSTGEMAANTTVDGYYLNGSGAWVK